MIAVVTVNILENTSNRLHVPNVWFSAFGTEFNQLYQEIRWFSAYIWYGNFRSKWRSVIRDLKSQIFYEIFVNMFLITFNTPVPFTTLLEAFRTFHAKKLFLMAEVLSYPFNGLFVIIWAFLQWEWATNKTEIWGFSMISTKSLDYPCFFACHFYVWSSFSTKNDRISSKRF